MNDKSQSNSDVEVVLLGRKSVVLRYLPYALLLGPVGVGCMISTGSYDIHIRNAFSYLYGNDSDKSTNYWTAASVMFPAFGFVATFVSIPVVKVLGNKENSIIGIIVGIVGGVSLILSYIFKNYFFYLTCRVFQGYSAGAICTSCIVHIYQLVHPSKHSLLSVSVQASINLGIFLTGIFSLKEVVGEYWIAQAFPMLVCLACALVIIIVLPNSPLATFQKTRNISSVKRILRQLRSTSYEEIEKEAKSITATVNESENMRGVSVIQMLRMKDLMLPLLMVVLNGAFQQLCGINAAMFYGGQLMNGIIIGREDLANIILFSFSLAGSILLSPFPKLLGPKRVLYIGYLFMAVSFYVSFGLKHNEAKLPDKKIIVYFISLFAFMFQIGPGPVPLSLFSNYFNIEYHVSAQNLAQVSNWLSNFLVTSSFLYIKRAIEHFVLLMFAIFCTVFAVILIIFMADPKGKTADEVKESYDKSVNQFSL